MEDMVLPLSTPVRGVDGKLTSEIVVPRKTVVVVGNWICNTDKTLWGEDAEEWKPERWLSPLPEALKSAKIPGIYANQYVHLST